MATEVRAVAEPRSVDQEQATAPARHKVSRLTINRLGLWLFIISETFLSGAIISSRYFLRGLDVPEVVNQPLGCFSPACCCLAALAPTGQKPAPPTATKVDTSGTFWPLLGWEPYS